MKLSFDLTHINNFPNKLKTLLDTQKEALAKFLEENSNPHYEALAKFLERQQNELHHLWSPISHMHSVKSSDALRAAYEACLPFLSESHTWYSHYQPLFQAFQAIEASAEFHSLTPTEQKYVQDTLRDFKLTGVDLPEEKKKQFAEISLRLSELANQFEHHIMDATEAWEYHVNTSEELSGVPASALKLFQEQAKAKQLDGYLINLHMPSYLPIITYADNSELRKKLYEAHVTRASELGPHAGKFNNSPLLFDILNERYRLAHLLGFNNYAEYALTTRMAKTPEQVNMFLEKLAALSKPFAEKELLQLKNFANALGIKTIEPWDVAYLSEKLKQQELHFDDEQLRPYFPLPIVLEGLFKIVSTIYQLHFKPAPELPRWHDNVEAHAILNDQKKPIAYFYLDLYAREKKRGGAWMDDAQAFWHDPKNGLQLPIAYLTCNFTPPLPNQPALLNHDEMVTLFHEFGHGLQHMLTQVPVLGLAGISGVEWDAVELPSQLLENWCWNEMCLAFLSQHVENKKSLPNNLLKQLLASKNFLSGLFLMRQLEFALFDLRLHWHFDPAKGIDQIQQTLDQVRQEVTVLPIAPFNRFQHSFSHIFAGGYAAGYYSYLWAEVLAQDAFAFFEEHGILSPIAGEHFKQTLLSQGGSASADELFRRFRGRDPDIEALLKSYGLK